MKYKQTNNSYSLDDVYKMCAGTVDFAVYGFGDSGKLLYSMAHQNGWQDRLVAIFDRNAESLHKSNIEIRNPDDVKNVDFHKIIVTNFAAAETVGKFLVEEHGIASDKILFLEMNELQAGVWQEHDQEWLEGAKEEVHFWETKIGARVHFPNRCISRASSNKRFNEELLACFSGREQLTVLNVGSGPVTTLGYSHPEMDINLTMADPLADNYAVLYDKYDFHPPVKPKRCAGEELLDLFESESFDLVYSCNALDHAENPALILRNMCSLLRKEGRLHVTVLTNEAVNARYTGLHKWNFEVVNDRVRLWQPGKEYDLHNWLANYGALELINNDVANRTLTFGLQVQ